MSRSRRTVILLANPTAGGGAASRVARQAVHTFSGLGLRAFLVAPAGPAAAGAEVRRALAALRTERVRPWGLVAVGGDGTVRLAARLAYRARLPLGVVPAGTGNGAAYSLGLPLDPWEACRVVARGVPVPCDLGRLEFIGRPSRPEFFLNVAGVGLDADITRVYHQGVRRLRGVPGYVVAALRSLASTGPTPLELELDGQVVQLDALLFTIGNGRYYGKGIAVVPPAHPADGVLDVCVVLPAGPADLSTLVPRLLLGRHIAHPKVRMVHGREFVVRARPGATGPVAVHADGDVVGELPVRVTVLEGALRVLGDPRKLCRAAERGNLETRVPGEVTSSRAL